eukprot:jgi/Phyca11/531674/estExt2_fgenesh1_pg.C_PHYCAscaffold_10340
MSKTVGVPISLLHEGEGRTVTIELKNGEVYRGHLTESEESMNCQLSDVVLTQRDGQKSKLELVYVRGSQIKLVILPDILKNSPLLGKVQALSKKNEDSKKKKKSGKTQGRKGANLRKRPDIPAFAKKGLIQQEGQLLDKVLDLPLIDDVSGRSVAATNSAAFVRWQVSTGSQV